MKALRLIGVLSLALLAHAGAAYGASAPTSPNDPPAGSPAAAVYELPFEKGRADAAPGGTGGTAAGGGNNGVAGEGANGESSFYRSENNFGSSSEVPGAESGGSSGRGAGEGAGGGGSGGAGENPSPGGAESGAAVAGITAVADSGNTSPAAIVGLLGAIALVAGGVGVIASRTNRLSSQQ
jgi:hypothetical protein